MTGDKVVSMADHRPPFEPPVHFLKRQRAAWDELVGQTPAALHVLAMKFTFEFAATLLAKFRSGKVMSATEQKELRHHLGVLGLRPDDGSAPKGGKLGKYTQRKNDHYFD